MVNSGYKISIALCTFNGAQHLPAQLNSIAIQHRLPDELVVCDDQSNDDTVEIIKRFARQAPFPVYFDINEENLGTTKNFEKAVALCKGDIITFCDQDDVWREDKLVQIEAVFSASPRVGAVFSDAELVNEDLEPLGHSLWQAINFSRAQQERFVGDRSIEALLKCISLSHGMMMAFRAIYKTAILPFPPRFGHDNWTALIIAGLSDLAFIRQPLIRYRQHQSQQVGPPTRSHWMEKLIGVQATTAAAFYWAQADLFTSACRRVEGLGAAECHREKLALLQAKAKHMLLRANIPNRGWQRWPVVLKELAEFRYHRYSNGVLSAVKDIVLQ